MPCIIEYSGGTKGDFLTQYLTDQKINLKKFNKTDLVEISQRLKSFLYESQNKNDLDTDTLIKLLEELKKFKFINVHSLEILERFNVFHLLFEHGYSVKKICYNKKYYKTISIESFVKNINEDKNGFETILDHLIVNNNLEINDDNRSQYFENFLNHVKQGKDIVFHHEFNKLKNHREIWNYEDLYINFNLEDLVFQTLNIEDYKAAVAKTWIPNKIDLFGRTWDLTQYGYLQF